MRALNKLFVGALALGLGIGALGSTATAEMASDAGHEGHGMMSNMNHEERAAAYDAKAKDLDAVIAEHQQMKKSGMTEKTPASTRTKMEKHCDAIIKDAAKLRDDYKAFAQHHRMMAMEQKSK